MTNDRPSEDGTPDAEGEELVEADLPGMDGTPPSSSTPEAPGTSPADLPPDPEPSAGDSLVETMREVLTPDPFDAPVEDSVINDLGPHLVSQEQADRGLEDLDAPADAPSGSGPDEWLDPGIEPFEDDTVRRAIETEISPESRLRRPPEPDPTNDSEATDQIEGGDLVEADLPTTSTTESAATSAVEAGEGDPLEAVDRAVEEWGERLDDEARTRREERLQSYRDEYGADVDAEGLLRHDEAQRVGRLPLFERVLPSSLGGRFLTVVLAGMGSVIAIIAATSFFGGSDDDAAVSVPAAATIAATSAPTEVPTAEPTNEAGFTETERTLALMEITAAADLRGDLWLRTELNTGLSGAPDTVAFLYAFALGAAVQTEDGYNGAYYSVTDGLSYAEGVFGSPDFPRTSGQFNAGFQIEQADLWITDDGQLAIHVPGGPSGGGLDASLFGPDTPLIAGVSFLEEQGGTAGGGFEEFTLGEIATGLDWPAPGWTELEPDQQPLQLNVPDTSNRN